MALKIRPELKAIVAGDGLVPSNNAVQRLIELNSIPPESVKLCGEVSDMSYFYNSIDTLVLSSRTESFPNVVAEAMSYGKPVITTDVGDAAVIVNDMTCVVEPGQPEALAEKIVRFADMEHTEFRKLAEAARTRIVDTYSMGRMYNRYQEVIDQFTP